MERKPDWCEMASCSFFKFHIKNRQPKLGGGGSCLLPESTLFPGLALPTLEKYSQVLGCSCSPCLATTESARTLLCTRNFERVPWLLSLIFLTDVCGARTVRTQCSTDLELISYLHRVLNQPLLTTVQMRKPGHREGQPSSVARGELALLRPPVFQPDLPVYE